MEKYDINHVQVQLTMVIKLQQLQREALPTLAYQYLEEYLHKSLWKHKTPRTLADAANDILMITASDIVRFMNHQAILESSRESLADYLDVIGG